jgi:D-alanyl-lipoteichoic acid acyltransferase DltB (MBOAT superfamily)
VLFNSYSFLIGFLPVTVLGFFLLARWSRTWAAGWLAFMSLVFYGWWNVAYVTLLMASIVANYWIGTRLAAGADNVADRRIPKRLLLAIGIAANLCLLGYYKYANFFVETVATLSDVPFSAWHIILPLGISFFTFTQIAFLVDAYRGRVREYRFVHYTLFVTYFPHLIAGPVLHHSEMMPQFEQTSTYKVRWENFAVGGTIFLLGLFKKTVLADGVAHYANQLFGAAAAGRDITIVEAWSGALAYTCQLYFDFSGYSDMAIGLSRLFGVRLPLNFASPYKATSVIDFWRRWHITLSRFLRDYLYFPLGGNRKGRARRYVNLFVTMLLGGLWHGAGFTFIAWGALHGFYLVVNHAWRALTARLHLRPRVSSAPGRFAGAAVTFIAVVLAWVLFRSPSLDAASRIYKAMISPRSAVNLDWSWTAWLPESWVGDATASGFAFVRLLPAGGPTALLHIATLLAIIWLLPNVQQFLRDWRPALDFEAPHRSERPIVSLAWQPHLGWAVAMALIGVLAVSFGDSVSEFLYYQF